MKACQIGASNEQKLRGGDCQRHVMQGLYELSMTGSQWGLDGDGSRLSHGFGVSVHGGLVPD